MYKTLRGENLKRVLPRIIVCAVLVIALLACSGGGLMKLAAGPVPLSSLSTDELPGKFVTFDASEIIVACASLSSSDSSGKSHTMETYYLLLMEDGTYVAVMDKKEKNAEVMDKAMEQSYSYYFEDLETLTPLGPISGTVGPLSEDMPGFMTDCIDNYALPGYEEGRDSGRLITPYQITLDQFGFLNKTAVLVLGALALLFLLLLILQLVIVFMGVYQKKVRDLIGPEENAEFDQAVKMERVYVGKYILYPKGAGTRALQTEDLVWGYAMQEPLVVNKYRWPVALYDREKHLTQIYFMEQKHCKEFLNAVAAQGYPFRIGYSSAMAEQFQENYPGFLADAEKEAKARQSEQTDG